MSDEGPPSFRDATPGYWALVAVTVAGLAAMNLWALPQIKMAAGGLSAFDSRWNGYSLPEAQAFLAALSDEGRAFYGGLYAQIDAVLAPLIFASLAVALWHLTPTWRKTTRGMLIVIPAVSMVADGFENVQVRAMLIAGADGVLAETVFWASFLTVTKAAGFVTAFAALALIVIRHVRGGT